MTKMFCLPQSPDSEDLMVESGSSLPPSGQEKHNFPSYKELLDVVTRAVDKLGLDWNCEPTNIQVQSKLDGQVFHKSYSIPAA